MAKYPRQKLKLFYLRDFLLRSSDEEHLVTIKDMIAHLAAMTSPPSVRVCTPT